MLLKAWKEQPSGYYSLSLKKDDQWKDFFFTNVGEAFTWINQQKSLNKGDLYFCITPLKQPKRIKENVLPSRYLWQDLDEADPQKLPANLKPTIAWQSSPGRYQALWRLNKLYDPKSIEDLNRRLAEAVHADKGSWILTKVLRIPGTRNFKYPAKPIVKLLWDAGPSYTYDSLSSQLSGKKLKTKTAVPTGEINLLEKKWSKIPPKVRKFLTAKQATVGKRSDILWFMEHDLMKAGFSASEVYQLVKDSVWNKYKDRGDEEVRLTEEIAKVFEHRMPENTEKEKPDEEEGLKESVMHLVLENDIDLMTNMAHYPGWLVEGFWTRKSHGIVAGEPKSFKSTLTLDLAVSVASGQPFLGQFEVNEPGPVLIIQNENAPWIMKDRLNKIRTSRGLTGDVLRIEEGVYQITFPQALPIYYINQQGFSFDNDYHKDILVKIMRQVNPVLVIFDPLYLMFAGDVNTSKDLNPVLTWLLNLKDQFQCSLILIHHWKKGTIGTKIRGGQRILGSTVLHGWVESAWYIEVRGTTESEEEERPKKKKDEDEMAGIKSPSANVKITLDREFRGAGTYPKVDMEIRMGEFGSSDYEIKLGKHATGRGKKITLSTKEEIDKDILNFLTLHKGRRVSNREISRELGLSRKTVEESLDRIKGGTQNANASGL